MKKFFYLALAAAAMASCSSDESITSPEVTAEAAGDAVSFGVYTQTTRSNVEYLSSVQQNGFGVFAFSQMLEGVSSYSKQNYMPNFMFNQKVTYDTPNTKWIYEPVKYWPNNAGALVSFYAYAPYLEAFNNDSLIYTPESNDYTYENKTLQDKNVRLVLGYDSFGPAIEYTRSSKATDGIDLLWGADKSTVTVQGADPNAKAPVDKEKLAVDKKIEFVFKHAMSRLHFNVQVWPDEPGTTAGDVTDAANKITDNTTIVIKKVELIGNIWNKGSLRLYDGQWKHDKGDFSNLVFEGDDFSDAVKAGLKGDEAQKEIDLLVGESMENGAMIAEKDIDNFVMLMPDSKFYIQITYDVITKDPLNDKNTSVVTNVIKSTDANAAFNPTDITASSGENRGYFNLVQGKAYNVHLNIGLTSVKFDADVEEWNTPSGEVSLPDNN